MRSVSRCVAWFGTRADFDLLDFGQQVRHAALLASVAYLTAADAPHQLSHLLYPMLETLPALAQHTGHTTPATTPSPTLSPDDESQSYYSHLSEFLTTLTPLCSSHPYLFQPHLPALLTFLPPLILPTVDAGPTPTVGRPFPSHSSAGGTAENGKSVFVFPPPSASRGAEAAAEGGHVDEEDDEKSTLRLSALEFMVSLSEAKSSMVKKAHGWADVIVRACLEGMGELDDDALDAWLREDVSLLFRPLGFLLLIGVPVTVAFCWIWIYRGRVPACAL
jgi:hypothetical protein